MPAFPARRFVNCTESAVTFRNREDRQQCSSEQWQCDASNPMCQAPGTRDNGAYGDGYGPGAGFLKTRQYKQSMGDSNGDGLASGPGAGSNAGYNDGYCPQPPCPATGGYANAAWRVRADTQRFCADPTNLPKC